MLFLRQFFFTRIRVCGFSYILLIRFNHVESFWYTSYYVFNFKISWIPLIKVKSISPMRTFIIVNRINIYRQTCTWIKAIISVKNKFFTWLCSTKHFSTLAYEDQIFNAFGYVWWRKILKVPPFSSVRARVFSVTRARSANRIDRALLIH